MAKGKTGHKLIVTMPDMGLSPRQVNALKRTFKNEFVNSLSGSKAALARRIIIIIIFC
jgi:hypothetical protein